MITEHDINAIRIEYVILLDSDEAGDIYMENLYPFWVDPIVYTLEGKYPVNPLLRIRTQDELIENKNIAVVTFGPNSDKFATLTNKRISMAPLFFKDLNMFFWQKPVFEFNEQRIIQLIKGFCLKPDTARLQSYGGVFDLYKQSSIKWYHKLIT